MPRKKQETQSLGKYKIGSLVHVFHAIQTYGEYFNIDVLLKEAFWSNNANQVCYIGTYVDANELVYVYESDVMFYVS